VKITVDAHMIETLQGVAAAEGVGVDELANKLLAVFLLPAYTEAALEAMDDMNPLEANKIAKELEIGMNDSINYTTEMLHHWMGVLQKLKAGIDNAASLEEKVSNKILTKLGKK